MQAEVWMRPCASVAGTRCTRCVAGLELEPREDARARDARDDLLVAAVLARALAEHLDLPALALGVARVHAEQVAGEDRGFVAAGAGADLEEDVAVVARVLRDEQPRELERLGLEPGVHVLQFLLGERAHLGVGAARQLLRGGALRLEAAEGAEARRDRLEPRVLHGQVAEAGAAADHLGVGEQPAHLLEALDGLLEPAPDRVLHPSRSRW